MPEVITQQNRLLRFRTKSLGDDVLLMNTFTATESISGLFQLELGLLAEKSKAGSVVADDVLLDKATAELCLDDDYDHKRRYFNGVVSRFTHHSFDESFVHYTAEIVPWAWLLTLTSDCRIFQDKTVPEIIKEVFDDLKKDYPDFVTYQDSLGRNDYTRIDYCVQYRETDFNFVSRLMEQEGIYYFFDHEADKHTLVLADVATPHASCPGQSALRSDAHIGYGENEDTLLSWQPTRAVKPSKYVLRDYNFQMPGKQLEVTEPAASNLDGRCKSEVFDYPGDYAHRFNAPEARLDKVEPEGQCLVKVRMEEEEAARVIIRASSDCRALRPGYKFDRVTSGETRDPEGPYLLTAVQHSALQTPHYNSSDRGDTSYSNTLLCVPAKSKFRPQRVTPKPVIQGPQTAVVVGPQAEEIYTDEYGRIKVQFHWDRLGKKDDESSCWIRVATNWAGAKWGGIWIPRIGQEVVVNFLEGDPDQPLVTGTVYNAAHMPPYALPDKKTVSTLMSRSTKDGGAENFNEIRFEDKKGAEQIFINAERDLDFRVEHDSREAVGSNKHLIVGSDQLEEIAGNRATRISKNLTESIEASVARTVSGDEVESIGGGLHIKAGDEITQQTKKWSLTADADMHQKVGSNAAIDVGQAIHLKAGTNVVIEAGVRLTLKAAGGFIDIGPSGIAIQGILVNINSGGSAGSGSGSSPNTPKQPEKPQKPEQADDGPCFGKKG